MTSRPKTIACAHCGRKFKRTTWPGAEVFQRGLPINGFREEPARREDVTGRSAPPADVGAIEGADFISTDVPLPPRRNLKGAA